MRYYCGISNSSICALRLVVPEFLTIPRCAVLHFGYVSMHTNCMTINQRHFQEIDVGIRHQDTSRSWCPPYSGYAHHSRRTGCLLWTRTGVLAYVVRCVALGMFATRLSIVNRHKVSWGIPAPLPTADFSCGVETYIFCLASMCSPIDAIRITLSRAHLFPIIYNTTIYSTTRISFVPLMSNPALLHHGGLEVVDNTIALVLQSMVFGA